MNDNPVRRWLQRRGLLTITTVMAVALLLAAGGKTARLAFRYDRIAIQRGEIWRLFTGHIVHGSWQHVFVNLLGLALMVALFQRTYSFIGWCLITLIGLFAIDSGFWLLMPDLTWYVGLSGVLHTALAAGAVAWWRTEDKRLAAALSMIMLGKLTWEQLYGALPLSGALPVVVNAHLYGAIGGLLGGLLCWRTLPQHTNAG